MACENDFAIARVKWAADLKGSTQTLPEIAHEFWVLVEFLQREGLMTRRVASSEMEISEDFAIMRSDLTALGYELIKMSYEKWLNGLDRGKPPEDLRVFQRDLTRVRRPTS